ncbi:glycosyltransferase family 4 protein [Streptomyces sp. NPDC020096]
MDRQPGGARRRILIVSDVSGPGLGGVPVFNQELTEALAREHDVTLLTADRDTIPHPGAKIVSIGVPEGVEMRDALAEAAARDPRSYGLADPEQSPYDLIIGHSRFSGPAAAALRENWYPNARVAHFLHTSPERLDALKGQPQKGVTKAEIECEVMQKVDLVVGVGPLLTEEARRLSTQAGARVPGSHELIPGTKIDEPVQYSGPKDRLNLLVMGRTDDPIKGVDDALAAVNLLRSEGLDVHLTVRGADPASLQRIQQQAERLAGGREAVTVLPFTKDSAELRNDIRGADAVIMPSKHEGFGLVATEAAGHGVPILVNEESGAARFLGDPQRIPSEIGKPCVVAEPPDPDMRPEAWADAISRLKEELPQRQQNAMQLREALKGYSWDHSAHALTEAAMRTTPATHHAGVGNGQRIHASVQAAHGQLITQEAPSPPGAEGEARAVAELLAKENPNLRGRLAARRATPLQGREKPVSERPTLPRQVPHQGTSQDKGPSR